MTAALRLAFITGAAAMLSGCNMVMTEKPMFTVADGVGAPAIRAGVWRDEKPGCDFDEALPQDKWPKCAGAKAGPGDHPFWVEASGDPIILQLPLHLPGAKSDDDAYVYAAVRPLKYDDQGRVIAMKRWPVRCGPPPPPPEMPPMPKVDESERRRQMRKLSAADRAKLVKAEADLDKLQVESQKMLVELAKSQPTKQPLPGLVMDDRAGSCTPESVASLRAAAKAGEVWADTDAVSHWVRDRGPGDKPAATASSLLDESGGGGLGGASLGPEAPAEAQTKPTPISAPVIPPRSEASCDADRIRYAAKVGVPCWSLGAKVNLPVASK